MRSARLAYAGAGACALAIPAAAAALNSAPSTAARAAGAPVATPSAFRVSLAATDSATAIASR